MKISVTLTVNGKPVSAEVESRTLLVEFLRERLQLTGTHVGCDTAQCGACTVLVDGRAVKSCNMLAVQAAGRQGHHHRGAGQRRRRPASDAGCLQAEPRSAVRLLHARHGDDRGRARRTAARTRATKQIREALDGNFCRCTGYHNIVKSVKAGLAEMK